MTENWSRLLQRQIRRHVPPDLVPALTPFLVAINDSYLHYEHYRSMLSRAMEISSTELKTANSDLRQSNEALETFNYAAAHDLKNHALNIQNMVGMMRKYWDTDRDKLEQVRIYLDRSVEHFLKTVHGLLYIAKLQAQGIRAATSINSDDLKDIVAIECRHLVERKQALVTWTFDGAERQWPEQLMKTILVNLVTNSIKYSKPGVPPIVNIHLQNSRHGSIISVRDNGRGIDLARHNKALFKLFSRLGDPTEEEGTGVGLYLVKKLVEHENGTIHIESKPGLGTTMKITLLATAA